MIDFHVESAGAENVAALAALHGAAFGDAAWGETEFAALFATRALGVLAVGADGAPIGLCLWRCAADEAEILTIGVVPSARRHGVARALMAGVAARALALEARRIFLEVAEDNAAAYELYESLGYKTVGRRKGYYRSGADALLLVTDLPLMPSGSHR